MQVSGARIEDPLVRLSKRNLPASVLWSFLLLLWLFSSSSNADVSCHGIDVVTNGASATDLTLVCEGVAKAQQFFQAHGLTLPRGISLYLHPGDISSQNNHIGIYNPAEARIDLLTFARAHSLGKVFRSPMSRSLYVSFVVHELAHAVVDKQFASRAATRLAHEYIAYTAQLSSLGEDEVHAIMRKYRLQGFQNLREISLLYYQLDPCAFGLKAYLHYRGIEDKPGFIRQLLDGKTALTIRPVNQ